MSEALAALLAFFLVLLVGPGVLELLRQLRFGQSVRLQGPREHFQKSGTPTMGGVLVLFAVTATVLLLAPDPYRAVPPLLVIAGFGLLGLADDWLKIRRKSSTGLLARVKVPLELLLGVYLGVEALHTAGTRLWLPFAGPSPPLPPLLVVSLVALVVLATANAVNLTDGLDGLAAGSVALAVIPFLSVARATGAEELAILGAAVMGACAGFLWFNAHPAQVFMGDTGSLGLGAALAALASLTGTELVLPIAGGLFVLETLSVILQVATFRLLGRRVLRMSPLHHHFELAGWPEPKVVTRFWIFAAGFALLGLMAAG